MKTRKPPPVRVLIADDHRLFAEALEAVLSTEKAIEVVGRAANGEEAVELARQLQPDVVALDISMPVMDGFEAAVQLDRLERARGRRSRPPRRCQGLHHEGRDRGQPRRRDPRGRALAAGILRYAFARCFRSQPSSRCSYP